MATNGQTSGSMQAEPDAKRTQQTKQTKRPQAKRQKLGFHQQLVLTRWMYRFFVGGSLDAMKERLGPAIYEGLAEDGQTHYYHLLAHHSHDAGRISAAELLRYDLNIVTHWQAITEERNRREHTVMQLKYYQYLSLLFTEIYLDWYFNRRERLLDELNRELAAYNDEQQASENRFRPYEADDLNKLAFWNATGSGKTLLLHVNIRQYLHYYQRVNGSAYPDRIILLTPREELSQQHLRELELSRMMGGLFDKSGTVSYGAVDIIDINKLGDRMGDKTVAVEAFEGRNLVLVDEGHRGTGSTDGAWLARREKLCRGGFAFEYSATFGQAVAKERTADELLGELLKKKARRLFPGTAYGKLTGEQRERLTPSDDEIRRAKASAVREAYAKCILFDYSYKYFYDDGYGKESLILNLARDDDFKLRQLYLTACLLSFYQQQYLYRIHRAQLAEFHIEQPLWVFVGNKVQDDDSDLLAVLQVLADFVNEEEQARQWIQALLEDRGLLLDPQGRNIFEGRFAPLMGKQADWVYRDILRTLFNADDRQRLKLVNLRGAKGELALRIGGGKPFGILNVGDDSKFFAMCAELPEPPFDTETDDFGASLFREINRQESDIHVLLGSRKFAEGWSSWRVSTMGLLNMGRGEGSQIIQLFGRGVRLKGKDYSLKRSTPGERPKGIHLEKLETLQIFGVRADYMAQFRAYLNEEGISVGGELPVLDLPVRSRAEHGRLRTLALQDGYKDNQARGFKRSRYPELYVVPEEYEGRIRMPHATLDLYPKLESLRSGEGKPSGAGTSPGVGSSVGSQSEEAVGVYEKKQGKIPFAAMAMMDFDRVYLMIQQYKMRQRYSNLRLSKEGLYRFCTTENGWYTLYIPETELAIRRFPDVRKLENILIQLLEMYTDRFYRALKHAYEGEFYEEVWLTPEHPSLVGSYRFEFDDTPSGLVFKERLEALRELLLAGRIDEAARWRANHMEAILFEPHLYEPLFYVERDKKLPFRLKPAGLEAESEYRFVRDLQRLYASEAGKRLFGRRRLYLLRNADTKNKGLGFALAGNFYPDFMLWLVDEASDEQWLSFIDPKGIRNVSLSDPKFGLYAEMKTLEQKLGNPKLHLDAYILSDTRYEDLVNVKGVKPAAELEAQHVLFMDDEHYLDRMFRSIQA